jgi:hypothetical protein
MQVTHVQRWRAGRDTYRPAGETIRTADYEVAAIESDTIAKDFVIAHHYSGCYPAARFRYGLYRHGALVGVAVFSQPMSSGALKPLPGDPADSVELGRFVLLDDVPANGETWFLARAFEQLRDEHVVGVVSFSDPMPRRNITGNVVFGGHVGTIYQASNAVYVGRGSRRTLHMLPDGTVFSARAASKIRQRERGWRYAAAQLERFGVPPLSSTADAAAWLRDALKQVARTTRHPGNHKYAWALAKRDRRLLPASQPYPKVAIQA